MSKFSQLPFCQKSFFLNQTSSCICSMSLHCKWKVSNCNIKSCGRSWSAHEGPIYAYTKALLGKNCLSSHSCQSVRKPICDIVFCAMTFWFRCFNFLLSYYDFLVLCSVYDVVVLNGTIHEVETRYRRKDGRKRSCKYFNAVIVHVMLVGFFCIWNPCSWLLSHSQKCTGHATKWVLSLWKHSNRSNRSRTIKYETI